MEGKERKQDWTKGDPGSWCSFKQDSIESHGKLWSLEGHQESPPCRSAVACEVPWEGLAWGRVIPFLYSSYEEDWWLRNPSSWKHTSFMYCFFYIAHMIYYWYFFSHLLPHKTEGFQSHGRFLKVVKLVKSGTS